MTMTLVTQATGSKVPLPMLELIPSGYYAVRPDTDTPYTFMRLSRPTYGKHKGWVKIQTQHSDDLIDRWLWNPANPDPRSCLIRLTGMMQYFAGRQTIEDLILLLIVDHRKAARAYGAEIGKCHRCNKKLTDERSRWYTFGPECEESLEGEKDEIDDENGGSYEELVASNATIYTDWLDRSHG